MRDYPRFIVRYNDGRDVRTFAWLRYHGYVVHTAEESDRIIVWHKVVSPERLNRLDRYIKGKGHIAE